VRAQLDIAAGFAQEIEVASAEGAEYESQGQAPNEVRGVAPGKRAQWRRSSERAE